MTCADRTTGRRKHIRAAALPGMKPTRGQSQEPEEHLQRRNARARSTARKILILARPSGRRPCVKVNPEVRSRGEGEPKECPELHASPERENFSLEFRCVQIRYVQADHDLRCVANPPTRRRARDAKIRCDRRVPRALDEISKPVI